MKRYIFGVDSGHAKLLTDERFKQIWMGYGMQDPGLKYLRVTQFRLDPDDLADIHLLERHRYKDPKAAIAERFQSYACETAAGLVDIFKRPIYKVLYVCVEITDTSYDLSVLQDTHPIAIAGSKEVQQVREISQPLASVAIKNVIARRAAPLKQMLETGKEKALAAVVEARDGGMDM